MQYLRALFFALSSLGWLIGACALMFYVYDTVGVHHSTNGITTAFWVGGLLSPVVWLVWLMFD